MKNQYSYPYYFFLAILLIFGLAACETESESPTPAPTATAALAAATEPAPEPTPSLTPTTPPPSPTPTPTPLPTDTPSPTATSTPTPLEKAQSATVRVVVEGSEFLELLIGSGSGVIYESSGLVVTSNHLVEGAGLVQVIMEGRPEPLAAQVIGRSTCDDLAVLKLLGTDFPTVDMGTTAAAGSPVQIVGYPLADPLQTIVDSSISGVDLPLSAGFAGVTGTLQLDSGLDAGFSGAPVLDSEGVLAGLIVYTGNDDQHSSLMPAAALQPILAQLEQGLNLNWVGLNAGPLSAAAAEQAGIEPGDGLFVYAVDFRSPAGQAGIRIGDFITEIGDTAVTGEEGWGAYCAALRDSQPEEALDITIVRSGTRYLGQLNGDPLAEEVIVVETAPGTTPTPVPPVNSPKTELLGLMQRTESDMRLMGGTIDSLIANGCLAPAGEEPPSQNPPTLYPEAHPACVHSVSDCQNIINIYTRITNPPAINLTGASGAVINANNSLQAAIARFDEGTSSFAGACRSFIQDPNIEIGSNIFAFARFAVDEALNILIPAIQGLINSP